MRVKTWMTLCQVPASHKGFNPEDQSWLDAFWGYVQTTERVPENMGLVEWWGVSLMKFYIYFLDTQPMSLKVNQIRYPVWASLALDYLPIMASSVSSEWGFSSSGITITRQQNRLKGDVVEALQVVKCGLKTKMIL